jgi:hypothetical protein
MKPDYWIVEEESARAVIVGWGRAGASGRRTAARILRQRHAALAESFSDQDVLGVAHNRVAFLAAEKAGEDGWMRLVNRFLGERTRDPLTVPGHELQALQRLAGRSPDPGLLAAAEYHVMPDYYRRLYDESRRVRA